MPTSATPLPAVREALSGLIDYAGLFPPAKLSMEAAISEYETAREGPRAWMLGRFIVPAERLAELHSRPAEMPLSVIANKVPEAADDNVQAIEARLQDPEQIETYARFKVPVFVELSPAEYADETSDVFRLLAAHGLNAKIRCGGPTLSEVPALEDVALFLRRASHSKVPFKATAGLHHPIRAYNREAGFTMHGFLNLLVASALAQNHAPQSEIVAALGDEERANFVFDNHGMSWRSHHFPTSEVARLRKHNFLAYGSCSFSEPVADLQALGMLPQE